MKSSKYSIMIIPSDEGKERRFSISKVSIIVILISLLLVAGFAILIFVYGIPKLRQFNELEKQNKIFMAERVQIMELMQDLNRIEQIDKQIRKTLGSELHLTEEVINLEKPSSDVNNNSDNTINVSYVENIPSYYPVQGYITQKKTTQNIYSNQNHYGIDIAVKEGDPVYASAAGFVVFSGWTYDFGNYIIIYHGNDYFTVYGHNKNNYVKVRDYVKRGDVIGASGQTGISSGPHLHYEIWKDGVAVNPLELFPKFKQKDISVSNYD